MTVNPALPRFPAEWEPAEAIWIAWPHNRETWPGRFARLPDFYACWARRMAEVLPVRILAAGKAAKSAASLLGSQANVELVSLPTNDCWVRDYGPSFIYSKHALQAVAWRFNAWGGKYPPWDQDDLAAERISRHAGLACQQNDICLEGGAIESDGRGRLLTTPCLLTKSRNPTLTKEQMAEDLYKALGITEIAWIDGGGLDGDDTDGHIDQLARFIDPENVVVAVSDDTDDPNRSGLQANYRQLEIWGSSTEPAVEIHRLPIPPARFIDGVRVPESYCNFLRLADQCLMVPTFDCKKTDDYALSLLGELTGDREVIGIDCRDLIWGLGALHCASLNQPQVI